MKHISQRTYFSIILYIFPVLQLLAVPATPTPVVYTQPNGSKIKIYLKGDEFFHYKTTEDGLLVATNDDGFFTYAITDENGDIINTGIRVSENDQSSLQQKKLLKSLSTQQDYNKLAERGSQIRKSAQKNRLRASTGFSKTGNPKSLVLLVNFADKEFITPEPREAFSRMLNQEGYAENKGTGSARDYFKDSSMGLFEPEFVVVGPYSLSKKMNYYGSDMPGYDEGYDIRPEEMIIEACQLAHGDGVNFADFDIDNDGYVDNVFVFYAGYNQAEGAPAETIWPHRWEIPVSKTTIIDGKQIFDYACTSELRSNSGSEMCGIGTFVHEFGHVLGLPDYYPTSGSSHHTLGSWDVMDTGSYLNEGRTPPSYSSYNRFFLGWLTPELLTATQHIQLEPLNTSNKAYIVAKNNTHNIDGANPNPTEFFMLENRQKVAWDSYLPGHGLLITRINYNWNTWENNTVNDNPASMGVDIIEADGKTGNLSGDPFPGASQVDTYTFASRNNSSWNKMLTSIQEKESIISFKYVGSGEVIPPQALEATEITTSGFTANWEQISRARNYYFTAYHKTPGNSTLAEGFNNGLTLPIGWESTATDSTIDNQYCGLAAPALILKTNEYILTENYLTTVSGFSFVAKPVEKADGILLLEAWNNLQWNTVDEITVSTINNDKTINYQFNEDDNYTQFKITYQTQTNSKIAIDDIQTTLTERLVYIAKDKNVSSNYEILDNLLPDLTYYYRVRVAKNKSERDGNGDDFEISDLSNEIEVKTKKKSGEKTLYIYSTDKKITIYIPEKNFDKTLYIYDVSGRLFYKKENVNQHFIDIDQLVHGKIYIVKIDDIKAKIIF